MLSVGKSKKDLDGLEMSRGKHNDVWQTLQSHLEKYHQAEEQTKMTIMQDKTELKKNVDIKFSKDNDLNETAAKLDSLQIEVKRMHTDAQRLDQMVQDIHHRISELENKIKNKQTDKTI